MKYKLNIYCGSFLEKGFDEQMEFWGVEKFDVVVGNPPYQEKVGERKTEPIWNKFVKKTFNFLQENGYVCYVHPSGWRSPFGKFKDIYVLFLTKKLIFLSVNDFARGDKVFGVGTNFDFYVVQNQEYMNGFKTKILDVENKLNLIDIKELPFIPNAHFETFEKIVAKNGEESVNILHSYSSYETRKVWMSKEQSVENKLNLIDIKKLPFIPNPHFETFEKNVAKNGERVKILYSRSDYGTDKKNMSKEQTKEFKYPAVYTITKKDGVKFFWSKTNQNGHFGVPKLIWSNGLGTYPILDIDGKYGLTQFSYGIIDTPENLEQIKKVLEMPKFIKLMDVIKFTNHKYDYKVISTFRKDFWKEFLNK